MRGGGSGLLPGSPALFHRGLAVAFLQCGNRDGQDEFFLAMIVKLDHHPLLITGDYRA